MLRATGILALLKFTKATSFFWVKSSVAAKGDLAFLDRLEEKLLFSLYCFAGSVTFK